ncbi:hypothetical protein HYDPIDRAFT_23396 [Hydnomerulius pinastri MD-312]|nr:hypothetical protein HYDPIDRAFT_23396 [Hydnomerulius pinastri MD-312]
MEDAQPNEVRLSRKGSTNVPSVQITYRGGNRGRALNPFRGRGRGRGNPPAYNQGHYHPVRPQPRGRGGNQSSQHTPSIGSAHIHRSQQTYYAPAILPRPSHDLQPSKRAKLEISRASLPQHPKTFPGSGGNMRKDPSREHVTIKLPPECCLGNTNGYKARQAWIRLQEQRLGTERDLAVLEYEYLDLEQSIMFTCSSNKDGESKAQLPEDGQGARIQPATVEMGFASSHLGNRETPVLLAIVPPGPMKEHGRSTKEILNNGSNRCTELDHRSTTRLPIAEAIKLPHNRPFTSSTPEQPLNNPSPRQPIHSRPAMKQFQMLRESPPEEGDGLTLDSSFRRPAFRSGTLEVPLAPSRNASFSHDGPSLKAARRPSGSATREVNPQVEEGNGSKASSIRKTAQCGLEPDVPPNESPPPGGSAGDDSDFYLPLSDLLRQHSDPAVSGEGSSAAQPIILEDEPEEPLSHSNASTPAPWNPTSMGENFRLPLDAYDRPRRLLRDSSSAHVLVTAHGFVERVSETGASRRRQNIRSPTLPLQEFVDDACILPVPGAFVMVLAHAREDRQLTLLASRHNHALEPRALNRAWNTAKKGGVSTLTALAQPLQFATGGHDHKVHIWDVDENLAGASSVELAIKHTSAIHSLLPIRDTSSKLVSVGADCNIYLWDMSSEHVVRSFKTSSIPYNAHRTDSPYCTLLEVAHRELQFEIRDHRIVPEHAVQRFGFLTEDVHGRFMKGDTWPHFFVCGDRSGGVRLWDLRNTSRQLPPFRCFTDQVIQVVWSGSRVVACSKRNELAFVNPQGS